MRLSKKNIPGAEGLRKHYSERIKYIVFVVVLVVCLHIVAILLLVFGFDLYIPKRYEWLHDVASQIIEKKRVGVE